MTATEVDIVLIGDFRFPGGTSTSVASEISALAKVGYRIALVAYSTRFLSATRSFHPAIAAEIRAGRARLVAPGQAVKAGLACFHHPAVFEHLPAEPLKVYAEHAVLVVHHPPVDPEGEPQYDIARIETVLRSIIARRVQWAPVGPKVRDAFRASGPRPPLTSADWVNIIDPAAYSGARPGLLSSLPIVGRHSRPDPLKWPDTAVEMCAAYPDAADIRVKLLGFEKESVPGLERFPPNWEVYPFRTSSIDTFLDGIDFLSYFHSSKWTEAFGRSILEAMASGIVCLLPSHFEPLFGDGAVYCKPQQVAEKVRSFVRSPDSYARKSERAVDVVRERYSPEVAVERVRARIGPPEKKAKRSNRVEGFKPRVLYFTSNGIGMGHLTRVLACARRHRDEAEPIIVSMSRAYSVARTEGFMAEFIPFFRSSGMDQSTWHLTLRAELVEMFRFYRPNVVVLDGNVPYDGLLNALAEFPEIWKVWLRRAMWPPGVGEHLLKHQSEFDAVLEPGELAADVDRGLTVNRRRDSRCVAPIGYLQQEEALGRQTARTVLGLDSERPAVFLQLGSGNNMHLDTIRSLVIERLLSDARRDVPQIVVGEWQVGLNKSDLPEHVTVLRSFPFARFLPAFDFAVALAGYNTFHENLHACLPTLFLGNEHPEQDEQWLRAEYARVRGWALSARANNLYDIAERLSELSDPATQATLRSACRNIPDENGADDAASYLTELAHTRRPHPAFLVS